MWHLLVLIPYRSLTIVSTGVLSRDIFVNIVTFARIPFSSSVVIFILTLRYVLLVLLYLDVDLMIPVDYDPYRLG
jgi:hypothetical protein